MIYFNVVYEDYLSLAVIEWLLTFAKAPVTISRKLSGYSSGYILSKIISFHRAARHQPFFILLDSDNDNCALRLLNRLVPEKERHQNCIFRIAVHEVESWLLADIVGISKFLGINRTIIKSYPEKIPFPKEYLISLARRSRKRTILDAIVPDSGTSAKIGPEYNVLLSDFVRNKWNVHKAAEACESLKRALLSIQCFPCNGSTCME